MILEHLRTTTYGHNEERTIRNGLATTNTLCKLLRECTSVRQCVQILKAELTGSARPSFIDRIYSRYKVLNAVYDRAQIDLWRDEWVKQSGK